MSDLPTKPPMFSSCLFGVQNTDRNDFWKGRAMVTCRVLGSAYTLIAFGALLVFAWTNPGKVSELCPQLRILAIAIGIIVSAGPPAFFWLEAKSFDWWLNKKIPVVKDQQQLRETYKLNAENGKAFWAGILAVYAAVLLNWA